MAVPASFAKTVQNGELSRLRSALERIEKLRKGVYEDFKEGILSKEEYLSYRADYGEKENKLRAQLTKASAQQTDILRHAWVDELIKLGKLTKLDRATIAETIQRINIYDDGRIEIFYKFSQELSYLLDEGKQP